MKKYLNKIILKIDKKILMCNAIILVFTLGIFIGIDQFTKIYAFSKSTPGMIDSLGNQAILISKGKLFGMRLVTNTGMFSSLGEGTIPYGGIQAITSLISILVIMSALFSKNKVMVFGFSLIAAGALGNIMDRYMLIDNQDGHYVRDWIYNPWHDKGTYNIADIEVVFGSAIAVIGLFASLFKETKQTKQSKTQKLKNFGITNNKDLQVKQNDDGLETDKTNKVNK